MNASEWIEPFLANGLASIAHLALPPFSRLGDRPGLAHLELPFAEPAFAERHLKCQLDPTTDNGSRSPALRRASLEWFRRSLPSGRSLRVLHPMCGPGLVANDLLDWGIEEYLGVEIAGPIVDYAREHAAAPCLAFEQANIDDALALEASARWDVALLHYEAVNAMTPARLSQLLSRLRSALTEGGLLFADVRLPGQPGFRGTSGRSHAIAEAGSVFADGPHLILDEHGYLPDGKRYGNRIGIIPLDDPSRVVSVLHTFVWIHARDELLELFGREGFRCLREERPLVELATDARDSRGNTFFAFERG